MDKTDPRIAAKLREKVASHSYSTLLLAEHHRLRELDFNDSEIEIIKKIVSKALLSKKVLKINDIEDSKRWKTITFGCPKLDQITAGGIPLRGLTELFGESGAGKTQICLQLSLNVQLPENKGGLGLSAVYLCTEDQFPSKRLYQMVKHLKDDYKQNFMDNILVDHIKTAEEMKNCIKGKLSNILSKRKVGLIIIDSIAGIFRSEYTNYSLRAKDMRQIALQLHNLSSCYNAAILCVNQVTTIVDSGKITPALGLTWANLITTRLQASVKENNTRTLTVVNAPHLAINSCKYLITSKGVEDF